MFAFNLKTCFYEYLKIKTDTLKDWEEFSASHPGKRIRFVFDVETCCDRLYGGFKQDWKCGGEWYSMYLNILTFKNCAKENNFDFVFIFNGTIPSQDQRKNWEQDQINVRKSAYKVIGEPEKVTNQYWIPPLFLTESLIVDLKSFKYNSKKSDQDEHIYIFKTVDDHEKEIMKFCSENECNNLFTTNLELLTLIAVEKFYHNNRKFNKMEIFSGDLRLTRDYKLIGTNINLNKALDFFGMDGYKFGYMSIMLGLCKYLPEDCLIPFYKRLIEPKFEIDHLSSAFKLFEKMRIYILHQTEELVKSNFITDSNSKLFHCWKTSVRSQYGHALDLAVNRMLNEPISKISAYQDPLPALVSDNHRKIKQQYNNHYINESDNKKRAVANLFESDVVYHLMTKKIIYLPSILEPDQSSDIIRADELFRPVREHFYCLLFQKQSSPISVTEIFFNTALNVSDSFLVDVKPNNLDLNRFNKLNKDSRIDKFLDMMEYNGTRELFHARKIYDDQNNFDCETGILLSSVILRYILTKKCLLNGNDIKAFLATFVICCKKASFYSFKEYCEKKDLTYKTNSRAIHLASLFLYGYQTVYLLNSVCKIYWDRNFQLKHVFDGKVFQYFYSFFHLNLNHQFKLSYNEEQLINFYYDLIATGLHDNFKFQIDMAPYSIGITLKSSELASMTFTNNESRICGRSRGILVSGNKWFGKKLNTSESISKLSLLPDDYNARNKKLDEKTKVIEIKEEEVHEKAMLDYDETYQYYFDLYYSLYLKKKAEREKAYHEIDQRKFLRIMPDSKTIEERRKAIEIEEVEEIKSQLKERLKPDKNNKVRYSQLPPSFSVSCIKKLLSDE